MAFARELSQHVEDPRFDPQRRFLPDAELRGYAVGGKKAYPEYVDRQPVRILAHHPHRVPAIETVDPGGISGAYPVALEKDHDIADFFLLVPGRFDHIDTLVAYAGDLVEPFHIRVDDVEGRFAEPSH
jgi:hypothetical protein